jgi:hypothetical protein
LKELVANYDTYDSKGKYPAGRIAWIVFVVKLQTDGIDKA